MKDMQESSRNDNDKNMLDDQTEEIEIHDTKDAQAGQEGEQADSEKPEEKEKDPVGEAETIESKETVDTQERESIENDSLGEIATPSADESVKQYSCSYMPPYDAPHFSIALQADSKKEKSKGLRGSFVALLLTLSLLISVVGGGIGYVIMEQINQLVGVVGDSNQDGQSGDGVAEDGTITIIKNDGSIKVNEVVGSTGYSNLTVSEVVALVADSVVEITTAQRVLNGSYVTSGAGSGVIIGSINRDGYLGSIVITNHHVIDGADGITVRLTNGKEYTATLIAEGDEDYDIAVLAIQATGLSAAKLGSSANLIVGEEVVAIGNPLGELGGTVTNGIISALDRQVIVEGHRMTLLQTNAAINPGNSGGGLFNMAGELIGIVNAKQSETGIEGLGFAIPIDVAYATAKDLIDYGYVTGKLKLDFKIGEKTESFQVSSQNSWYSYTLPAGIYILSSNVAELKAYDRIVSLNGVAIQSLSDYYGILDQLKEDDTLTIVVSRLNTSSYSSSFSEITVNLSVEFTKAPQNS